MAELNIYLQLDTSGLKSYLEESAAGGKEPDPDVILQYTVLFDQNTMVEGIAIKNHLINLALYDEVNFTVLPADLASDTVVTFDYTANSNGLPYTLSSGISKLKMTENAAASFSCLADGAIDDADLKFNAKIKYLNSDTYPIIIDPKLRIDSNE